jgi:hypothetical protein
MRLEASAALAFPPAFPLKDGMRFVARTASRITGPAS